MCHWEGCREVFWLCSTCDFGQCYCSDRCREAGRNQSLQRARLKYARSGRGVENNRERQQRYRRRVSLKKRNGSPFTDKEKCGELERCPDLAAPGGVDVNDRRAAAEEMLVCGQEQSFWGDGCSEQEDTVALSPAPEGQEAVTQEIRYCHVCGRPGRVARQATLRGRFRWA